MILIVDDHADTAALLVRLLARIDLEAAHVGSAADAFSFLRQRGPPLPSLILLDIGMPKLNGYEACRRIREQQWGQDIVIVALTGWAPHESQPKPLKPGSAKARLADVLGTKEVGTGEKPG